MKIWEPKPPGTLWATPGHLRDFSLTVYNLVPRVTWHLEFVNPSLYHYLVKKDDVSGLEE